MESFGAAFLTMSGRISFGSVIRELRVVIMVERTLRTKSCRLDFGGLLYLKMQSTM